MTEEELEELIADCPTLYHMAERGSWASIKERGLLSTSALLDLYAVQEPLRSGIERQHRPCGVGLQASGLPRAVVRDQIPMSDAGLKRCLPGHLTPADWYGLLNAKAFFWLTEGRLHKLTGAKAYRDREHDVLEVDTRSLIEAHRDAIWLCPMNSGCTKPMPHPRDESTFARISDYPYEYWRGKRSKGERTVELAVDYSVPDIRDHVRRVVVKQGDVVVSVIE
ncbi:hypothetical protein V6C03_04295 [Methyloligella sp. 2.7D]|uniref:DUF7002 family protein n=1 Tax=unclassified Methyloligella TaxID=2625955 RepID=UPI00157BE872|nr:hypothetical protein [Methyloligella sp. GL2]QKP76178.1 hypothetical protein HT051_01135 [Methyloligella sp. GL2]